MFDDCGYSACVRAGGLAVQPFNDSGARQLQNLPGFQPRIALAEGMACVYGAMRDTDMILPPEPGGWEERIIEWPRSMHLQPS